MSQVKTNKQTINIHRKSSEEKEIQINSLRNYGNMVVTRDAPMESFWADTNCQFLRSHIS